MNIRILFGLPDAVAASGSPVFQRRLLLGIVALYSLLGTGAVAPAAEAVPRYFGAKPGALGKARKRFIAGDKDAAKAVKNLIKDAEEALKVQPPSVVEKEKTPPGGDKHDYMSLAPYFWPDAKAKEGLPYIRHDGKVNPESRDPRQNDSPRMRLMGDSIESLALAYYFTGQEKYAAQAAKFARVWFLDPATRMNPNFKYAQAVPGANDGRGTGILEARHIPIAADALGLLAGSSTWTDRDRNALDTWLNNYLDWLLTSDAGHAEHDARNNHGTYYDVQAAHLALCLGRADVARRFIEEARQRRVAVQIEPDGSQPLELARTTSFSYSRFNIEALCALATLGEHAGADLWHYTTADGRSIRRAIDYMLPFVDVPPKPWAFQQIKEKHEDAFMPVLRQASLAYGGDRYEEIIAKYDDARSKRFQLLFAK